MVGKRFERLLVVEESQVRRPGQGRMWVCLCDCGKQKVISGASLRRGFTRSCGCLHNEGNRKTHNGSKERLFRIWCAMRDRCKNKNTLHAKYYSLKNVTVCEEWLDYGVFKAWALSAGYRDNLTIDRIDSAAGYHPNNCRWITLSENSRRAHLGVSHGLTREHNKSGGLNAT